MTIARIMRESLRWSFNYSRWQPTSDEWIKALSMVQPEERLRIKRFVFRRDAKAALIGRLMIRQAVCKCLRIPYKDMRLGRTEKQKPILLNDTGLSRFEFNVAHHGDYTVLAAEYIFPSSLDFKSKGRIVTATCVATASAAAAANTANSAITLNSAWDSSFINKPVQNAATGMAVGIDVMCVERPMGAKSVEEFFSTMDRQFTSQEWKEIRRSSDSELEQLATFYRLWCLKESYVKAVGTGIGFSLKRLDFHLNTPKLNPSHPSLHPRCPTTDTTLYIDGILQADWLFHEYMLDLTHIVCVATCGIANNSSTSTDDFRTAIVLQDEGCKPSLDSRCLEIGSESNTPGKASFIESESNMSGKTEIVSSSTGGESCTSLIGIREDEVAVTQFQELSLVELLDGGEPLAEPQGEDWIEFEGKDECPPAKRRQ